MISIKDIFPECDADTLLVELITERGHANHNKGISNVSKALKRQEVSQGPLIAVVDTDKFKNKDNDPYLPKFTQKVCDLINQEAKLCLFKLPNKQHYIIYVHPEFEPWLWNQAEQARIDATDFGYSNYRDFVQASKTYGLNPEISFKKFVNAVVRANPPGILKLREWLVDHNFQ